MAIIKDDQQQRRDLISAKAEILQLRDEIVDLHNEIEDLKKQHPEEYGDCLPSTGSYPAKIDVVDHSLLWSRATPSSKTYTARVTAYAPFDNQSGMCNDGDPNYTSTGQRPSPRIIAVDPQRIPYGSTVRIEGLEGNFIAGDTGSALRGYDGVAIDIYVDTYKEAMDWGVQYLEIEVFE